MNRLGLAELVNDIVITTIIQSQPGQGVNPIEVEKPLFGVYQGVFTPRMTRLAWLTMCHSFT